MEKTLLATALPKGAKQIHTGLGFSLVAMFLAFNASAEDVNLKTANAFAVLAGSGITSTGPTTINGDIGTHPTTTFTSTGSFTLNGLNQTSDTGVMVSAKNDLIAAYNAAAGFAPTQILTGTDLGGLTLTPGVYFFSASADLTGTLTLNDQSDPDAVFIFQIGSTLTTAGSVVTINDPSTTPGTSVFWQVGSSATLGTGTAFEGNILALTSITADTGATDLDGRLLAQNGAVTLYANTITAPPAEVISGGSVPDTGSALLLLGSSLGAIFCFGWRKVTHPAI